MGFRTIYPKPNSQWALLAFSCQVAGRPFVQSVPVKVEPATIPSAAAVSELPGNESVTTHTTAVACYR